LVLSEELKYLNKKKNMKRILVVVVSQRHHANSLLNKQTLKSYKSNRKFDELDHAFSQAKIITGFNTAFFNPS
jgi:hypothetical protein